MKESNLKIASQKRLGISPAEHITEPLQLAEEIHLNDTLDEAVAILLSAKTTTPAEKKKLKGLLKYYAKKAHPFRACVRDNMKRFGPGKTEAYCAVLKDLIRGTTKWRGNKKKDHGSKGLAGLSEEVYQIDDELAALLDSISDEKIEEANLYLEQNNWKGGGNS